MIDSHCHLDMPDFDADRAQVVARARQAGVTYLLVPGVSPDTWARTVSVAQDVSLTAQLGLGHALGIHPQVVPELGDAEVDEGLSRLPAALRQSGAVAVGECGLDYRVERTPEGRQRQKRTLLEHIAIARQLELPLVLHVYKAHEDALQLLSSAHLPEAGGVLHSFSGSAELVPAYAALGLHFSFAGPVSWTGARKPPLAARAVPSGRLLLETDAPDQPPEPHRGQRSEPAFMPHTLAALARLREVDAGQLAEETTGAARRLLRLA
jgi:TatD DNase family protein